MGNFAEILNLGNRFRPPPLRVYLKCTHRLCCMLVKSPIRGGTVQWAYLFEHVQEIKVLKRVPKFSSQENP